MAADGTLGSHDGAADLPLQAILGKRHVQRALLLQVAFVLPVKRRQPAAVDLHRPPIERPPGGLESLIRLPRAIHGQVSGRLALESGDLHGILDELHLPFPAGDQVAGPDRAARRTCQDERHDHQVP